MILPDFTFTLQSILSNAPLARYVKLLAAHALGMPATLFPTPRLSDPDVHHLTCVTNVP